LTEIIGLLLVAAVAWYVASPLRTPDADGQPDGEDALPDLRMRRETLYREIADLDFDRRLGKVSEQDYQAERDVYLTEAAAVLEQIDRAEPLTLPYDDGPMSSDTALEDEIRRLRFGRES
jgi:hypothetical protein